MTITEADFHSDKISRELHIKEQITAGGETTGKQIRREKGNHKGLYIKDPFSVGASSVFLKRHTLVCLTAGEQLHLLHPHHSILFYALSVFLSLTYCTLPLTSAFSFYLHICRRNIVLNTAPHTHTHTPE